MAEIKNNFTGSKMNRDLDSRLIPANEYRYALNLQINKSEGSDVGTLQNILGNSIIANYRTLTGVSDLICIGAYADDSTNSIYVFLTNNDEYSYNLGLSNFIYVYNSLTNTNTKLVSGSFLNFFISSPILGINLIEGLLFWTDNRNQPRRINVERAFANSNYYTIEDQISVAKLTPVYPINLFKLTTLTNTVLLAPTATISVPSGTGPYTGTISSFTAFASNKLEIGSTVTATPGNPSSFTKGTVTGITYSGTNITSFTISSLTTFTAGSITSLTNTVVDQYETSMYDVVSDTLPDASTANPYYNAAYPGDATFLENKFVRFSYRYKFEDGEYSLMAPFTQIAFIPKQDGYFKYTTGATPIDDEANTYRSTVLDFMENKVNNILLQIPLLTPANQVYSLSKISSIEILYKESDSLNVNVIEDIPVEGSVDSFWAGTSTVYSYNYQAKKPFKTLPEKELIRVYDKTPIKAVCQEIAGNRIIYSNYQDKFYYPKTMDFNAGFSTKSSFKANSIYSGADGTLIGTSIKEYPNHSLKQNRNYQAGIVLCDKFGRQSGVILSNKATAQSSLGGGSLYVPYIKPSSSINPSQWPGYSLKIGFNTEIPVDPDTSTGWPGVYNGDLSSSKYNPLGWYSYKVVVKQTEQDYYNVYLPGIMAAYPSSTTLELGRTSHAVLINDNINKVPRDLREIGPTQVQFASSAILFPRVNNTDTAPFNTQYFAPTIENINCVVSTIATNNSLFYANSTATTPAGTGIDNFYNYISNPLIAKISTPSQIGIVAQTTAATLQHLAILETAADESKLDIYWETSTVGLITELNAAIVSGAPGDQIMTLDAWSFSLSESNGTVTDVTGNLRFMGADNLPKTPASIVLSVVDGNNDVVSSKFELYLYNSTNKQYRIRTTSGSYFFYSDNMPSNNFIFRITTTQTTPTGLVPRTFINNGIITNVAPIFTTPSTSPLSLTYNVGVTNIYTFTANNGANTNNNINNYTNGLTIGKNGTGSELFNISATSLGTASLTCSSSLFGTYSFNITATDGGGAVRTLPITVTLNQTPSYNFSTATEFAVTWLDGSAKVYNQTLQGTLQINNMTLTLTPRTDTVEGDAAAFMSININSTYLSVQYPNAPTGSITLGPGSYPYTLAVNIRANPTEGGYSIAGVYLDVT